MRARNVVLSICLICLLSACETQTYPAASRAAPVTTTPTPTTSTDPSSRVSALPAPDDNEVFLATRQIVRRGPTRDLRAAAFRYMNLRFSSGSLSSQGSSTQTPIKVTDTARLAALGELLDSVRGLPADKRGTGARCIADYDSCDDGSGLDAPSCSGPLLLCLAESFGAEPESE